MPTTSPTPVGVSVAARLNRLPVTRAHRLAVLAIGLGLFFDTYEIFLAGVLAAVLSKQFGLTGQGLALVLASAFIGQFLGAILLGRLADKLGRRTAFMLSLGIYSVFSLGCGIAPTAAVLVVFRFLGGLGMGAEAPIADSYLSDLLPAHSRGRYIAWAYTIGFAGIPAVGFLARWIVPTAPLGVPGWRWLFILGAAGSLFVWLLRRGLPESPRWLEAAGRHTEAEAVIARFEASALDRLPEGAKLPAPQPDEKPAPRMRVRSLLRRPYARRTGMLLVLDFFETIGYYGFGTLVPIILVAKGYSITSSLTFVALSFLGYPIGSLLAVPIMERLERKTLVVTSAIATAAAGLAFGLSDAAVLIVVLGFIYTLLSNVFSNAFHAYGSELFPTDVRGTAVGACYSMSRLSTALLPFVLLPVLHNYGIVPVFAITSASLIICALDVGLFGPLTTGRALERLTPTPATGDILVSNPASEFDGSQPPQDTHRP